MKQASNRHLIEAGKGTQYPPGESGNPKGRPPNSVTTLLRNQDKLTTKAICDKLVQMAKKGDLKAIDMFIDRTDGKVIGLTDITFNGEGLSDILLKLRGYSAPEIKEIE